MILWVDAAVMIEMAGTNMMINQMVHLFYTGNDSMGDTDSHDQQQDDDNNNNNIDTSPEGRMREKMRILGEQEHTLAEFDDEDRYKQRRTILFLTCLFFNTIGTILMLFSLGVTSLFEDFGKSIVFYCIVDVMLIVMVEMMDTMDTYIRC